MLLKRSRIRLVWKLVIGSVILLSGIISGLVLLNMSVDIRNQAYENEGEETALADVHVGPIESDSAVIGWDLVGLMAPVKLEYQNLASEVISSVSLQNEQQEVTITDLEPNQRYQFRFVNQETNKPLSGPYQFSTRKK